MSFVLDTNVLSELRKPAERADRSVVEWARSQPVQTLFLSVITVLEVELGIARVKRRDHGQGRVLQSWFDEGVLTAFEGRILSVDVPVARCAANLHVPDPRPERDALIAATAIVHGMSVATRNHGDFEPTGVSVINPWVAR